MEVHRIIAEIDAQILNLQQARALLAGSVAPAARPGRPKATKTASATVTVRKRKLSPEGRKKIADAMKKRWAERKKQSSKG